MAKLVAIGDSLTQGFQSLAINNTALSYPAIVAGCMGLGPAQFRMPSFLGCGGLPLNIEWLARRLEIQYGASLELFDWLGAVHTIPDLIDQVEDYWERGKGSRPEKSVDFHNLAVWGFEVADAYSITPAYCRGKIGSPKDNWFAPPSEPRLRTALRVLNPGHLATRDQDTQIEIARRIARDQDGIDHLIVALGANNCLGTVVQLKIVKTGATPPGKDSGCTLWTPKAFAAEYLALESQVKDIGARHVYLATVPHVTIPPITRGVMDNRGRLPPAEKYFDYYTRFFIADKDFDPARDPYLSKAQAIEIDDHIDRYNEVIRSTAQRNGWDVIDFCDTLDRLAVRRNHGRPAYPLPPALTDLEVRFFELNQNGSLKHGGLISLDGVHPTTCGYAIMANETIKVMRRHEPGIRDVDFADLRRQDALVSRPPKTLRDVFGMLRTLEKHFHLSSWLS